MKAVIDACVLYPTVLREIVIGVAQAGLIEPIWSARLLDEWQRTAARQGGAVDAALAQGEIAGLRARFPAAQVDAGPAGSDGPDGAGGAGGLWLPDRGDIHVLATAIAAGADTIVTMNLRDFPRAELAPHGVAAVHPDALLYGLWLHDRAPVADVVARVHGRAVDLSGGALALRALLKRARLPRLAKALG
jgi:hypothetical protein